MIDALIRLILRQRFEAARSNCHLAAVYIGQNEADKIRAEMGGMADWVQCEGIRHEDEPDFWVCDCPVYVLQRVKNHIGFHIKPE